MSFLKNARIRTKILSVIIPLCLVGLAATALIADRYKDSDAKYAEFIALDNAMAIELLQANRNLMASAYAAYQVLSYQVYDPKLTKRSVDFYRDNIASIQARFELARTRLPQLANEISGFERRTQQILTLTDQVIQTGTTGNEYRAYELLKEADGLILDLSKDINTFFDKIKTDIAARSNVLSKQTNDTIFACLSMLVVVFGAGIAASLFISSRGITKPIGRLHARMEQLAQGKAEEPVGDQDRRDEIGRMAAAVAIFRENSLERVRLEAEADSMRSLSESERREREAQKAQEAADQEFAVNQLAAALGRLADGDLSYQINATFVAHLDGLRSNFNDAALNLQRTLLAVGGNAQAIDAGANEIRVAADDLCRRTEQQAASIEEAAAALEQITTTMTDSNRRAQEAGELVAGARRAAANSGVVVGKAVMAMQEIASSSSEITNIIGVIDDIAFQTNLLALNAGVEAARAGEAGKGFAVVAQEVRELAQRSAKAAKEIEALIKTSGDQVRAGVSMVGETGSILKVIAEEVEEINRHVVAIVESSREQAVGLQEINQAVATIDQGTQQNAAMVEQSTAASHGLAQEAASLNRLLSNFTFLDDRTNRIRQTPREPSASDWAQRISFPTSSAA
ncbi:methyl-accepting chemotaxis protein [Neorhizobium galegae]|uniref:methyl-accepting chemotaxis protein n=1 Tax=Neorhizobium galegae TaxID=399 RepID=UPI000627CF41